jgi:hypothetical protein
MIIIRCKMRLKRNGGFRFSLSLDMEFKPAHLKFFGGNSHRLKKILKKFTKCFV